MNNFKKGICKPLNTAGVHLARALFFSVLLKRYTHLHSAIVSERGLAVDLNEKTCALENTIARIKHEEVVACGE
jgi:hypothetical protein